MSVASGIPFTVSQYSNAVSSWRTAYNKIIYIIRTRVACVDDARANIICTKDVQELQTAAGCNSGATGDLLVRRGPAYYYDYNSIICLYNSHQKRLEYSSSVKGLK